MTTNKAQELYDRHYTYSATVLLPDGTPAKANDNVAEHLGDDEHTRASRLQQIEGEVEEAVAHLMKALLINFPTDHNTEGTPGRVARMMVREVMRGRFDPMPDITAFPNALKLDELYVTGPITVRSMRSHHLVPIVGKAWVGVIPGEDSVIGLSKFNRLVDWVFARPQIQEEASIQLADIIEQQAKPKGLAIVVKATHMCMTWRGVREPMDATMTTSVMRGAMREDGRARDEFLALIRG